MLTITNTELTWFLPNLFAANDPLTVHSWHGKWNTVPMPPMIVHAYIEITPFDSVKYEVDNLLRLATFESMTAITSSHPPTLYVTYECYCGKRVQALCPGQRLETKILWIFGVK